MCVANSLFYFRSYVRLVSFRFCMLIVLNADTVVVVRVASDLWFRFCRLIFLFLFRLRSRFRLRLLLFFIFGILNSLCVCV